MPVRRLQRPTSRFLLLSALVPGLVGCSALERTPEAPRTIGMRITVEEQPSADTWRVDYHLAEPVAGVRFVSDRNRFRGRLWTAAATGARTTWEEGADGERLCFSQPSDTFAVAFRTFVEPLPKDYELNATFSEGSRLLYTGHLLVEPLATCGPDEVAPIGEAAVPSFRLLTSPERTVRLIDRQGVGELSWEPQDPSAARTYVFFGDLEPSETAEASVFLDPGMPDWMVDEMALTVPRLIERFTSAAGTPLPFRPVLFVTWGGAESSGRSFSGGTVEGLLVASAEGRGWLEPSPDGRKGWFHRMAHELFHLWDGETFHPDEDSEWLSEAAADHFAIDAALAMEVLTAEETDRWLVDQANDCLVRLGGEGLMHAVGGGDYVAWYACGSVALAYADSALAKAEPPSDLGELFRVLFAQAARTGSYGAGIFLGGLERYGVEKESIRTLQRLIGSGVPAGTDDFLADVLSASGVEVELVDPGGDALDSRDWAAITRLAIGRCYCGEGAAECDARDVGGRSTTLAGLELRTASREAWERLVLAVTRKSPVSVSVDGIETTVFCSADVLHPEWSRVLAIR